MPMRTLPDEKTCDEIKEKKKKLKKNGDFKDLWIITPQKEALQIGPQGWCEEPDGRISAYDASAGPGASGSVVYIEKNLWFESEIECRAALIHVDLLRQIEVLNTMLELSKELQDRAREENLRIRGEIRNFVSAFNRLLELSHHVPIEPT